MLSTNFLLRYQEHTMGKVLSQEMVFEKINFHMQQNKARSILILHMKSQSKIDERPNCEA
jgi:hypothetical protein